MTEALHNSFQEFELYTMDTTKERYIRTTANFEDLVAAFCPRRPRARNEHEVIVIPDD
jgi:hypothetical protein